MFLLDELYVQAVCADRARELAALAPARLFRRLQHAAPPAATGAQRQSAAQRVEQMMSELYGPGQPFDADPALFTRLAWVGIDG